MRKLCVKERIGVQAAMLLDRTFFQSFSTVQNGPADFQGREPYHKKTPCPNAFTGLCSARATFIQSASP
ncbi:hypothetical protein HNO86_09640 [Pseudomonas sp. C1C7]|uniref:hypothetical protein n=1 Tax=Pseudomonas sp. C1C7 TaxID=2735272 RepID=UPI001586ED95|nr:hypothetical protein [Pseudomonas sp. C1C7]NUT75303.1 hypothetical protein [Pseudomonas sp. C1C7]